MYVYLQHTCQRYGNQTLEWSSTDSTRTRGLDGCRRLSARHYHCIPAVVSITARGVYLGIDLQATPAAQAAPRHGPGQAAGEESGPSASAFHNGKGQGGRSLLHRVDLDQAGEAKQAQAGQPENSVEDVNHVAGPVCNAAEIGVLGGQEGVRTEKRTTGWGNHHLPGTGE
jgi:hypothetical protein